MIVTLWNYKGGVGKSTIALVLAEIAASKGLHTLAVDLDDQHNLAHNLSLTGSLFPSIEILSSMPEGKPGDLLIVDTHNTLDVRTVNALKAADTVLVPVYADYNSLINLRSVWQYLHDLRGGAGNVALVKNSISKLKLAADFEKAIDALGYPVAGRLPLSNLLMRNIALGRIWHHALRLQHKSAFFDLFSYIQNL